MRWFKKKINIQKPDISRQLPEIDEISVVIPSISQHLDAFRLPDIFAQTNHDTLPVTDVNGKVIGIVSEFDLAKIISDISLSEQSYMTHIKVSDIMTKKVWTEPKHTNISELLSRLPQMHIRAVPIVDEKGVYTGFCFTRTSIISFLTKLVKPLSLGGLATPLGVYITDGIHQAGAKSPGLFVNGVVFAMIIFVINLLSSKIFSFVPIESFFQDLLNLFIFLIILRFSPYSQIHAAEHKTINAIEKGFPLSVESVKRQSRIHSRCGTNILVLVLGVITVIYISNTFIPKGFTIFAAFIGFFLVLSYWKDMGRWLQKYFTTSEPSERLIQNGIKAGEEILKLHKQDLHNIHPSFLSKIWNMGLIQMLASFSVTMWLLNNFIIKILSCIL